MPQASEEQRARWPDGDQQAIKFLEGRGFTLRKDWTWVAPKDHNPTKLERVVEMDAIGYLINEWDFGGLAIVLRDQPLLQADVVDAHGDMFPRAVLEDMVQKANGELKSGKAIFAHQNFDQKTVSVQGKALGFSMGVAGAEVDVEVFDTPAGRSVAEAVHVYGRESLAVAAGGKFSHDDVKTKFVDGQPVREIGKVDLTHVAVVPSDEKTR